MTKHELTIQIENRVNALFANSTLYDNIRTEATENYYQYLSKQHEKPSLTQMIDFLDETVLKNAVSIAM